MKVKYSCHLCGLLERTVGVTARNPEQDVTDWMDGVVLACGNDHLAASPKCPTTMLNDISIPVPPDAKYIGQEDMQ